MSAFDGQGRAMWTCAVSYPTPQIVTREQRAAKTKTRKAQRQARRRNRDRR